MADSKDNNRSNKNSVTSKNDGKKIKVLYQYLGGQWYAFAEDESEVYFGKVPLNVSTKTKEGAKKILPTKKEIKESK
jgi:hypothetical protein